MSRDIPAELLQEARDLGVATLYESNGQRGALDPEIKPLTEGTSIAGLATTVEAAPGDNLAIHRALALARPGSILLVHAGSNAFGIWGEVTTVAAQAKGISALVTDGAVRDRARIVELEFPVFSRGVSVFGTSKLFYGELGRAVSCGGVVVWPGDVIVGDDDGVIAISADSFIRVVRRARERENLETTIMERLRGGANTFELYGFDDDRNGPVEQPEDPSHD